MACRMFPNYIENSTFRALKHAGNFDILVIEGDAMYTSHIVRDEFSILAPAPTWAPRRAVLTTLSNNIRQRQAKRKLTFEEPEVSGEEEEEVLTQSKKRAVMDEDSSLVPLMKEVEAELDFVQLINKSQPKPWVPLRELKERTPYPIVAAREDTNQHGRRVILKIINAGSKCEVYLPQRFASCIDTPKIEHFNKNCKHYVLVVTHKSPNWTDIKIVNA
ncbi:uncharacterized protein LOC120352193 [Nilaparvata lugens]|uniref:uncharacterized protein LOC120352193 n=1 Tax=Nilaparvata lugens TaxID=108931 RepID=UPI00193E6B97|nr:uncharacterized protein LOC120352193 [Nilaparvata lugens]